MTKATRINGSRNQEFKFQVSSPILCEFMLPIYIMHGDKNNKGPVIY